MMAARAVGAGKPDCFWCGLRGYTREDLPTEVAEAAIRSAIALGEELLTPEQEARVSALTWEILQSPAGMRSRSEMIASERDPFVAAAADMLLGPADEDDQWSI